VRAFIDVRLDPKILSEVSRVIVPMLALYGILRGVDLVTHGAIPYLFHWREETLSFCLEIGLFVLAPLYARRAQNRVAASD
jgi:hypothetical protein